MVKTRYFPAETRTSKGCLLLTFLLNIVLKVLVNFLKNQEKEIKIIQVEKEKNKAIFFFSYEIIVCVKTSSKSTATPFCCDIKINRLFQTFFVLQRLYSLSCMFIKISIPYPCSASIMTVISLNPRRK